MNSSCLTRTNIIIRKTKICNDHLAQTLHYMKLADTPVGIIANFQNKSLIHKRLINS
ncbi:MAG: GxxExxY protein [Flavobacterium sp.]